MGTAYILKQFHYGRKKCHTGYRHQPVWILIGF